MINHLTAYNNSFRMLIQDALWSISKFINRVLSSFSRLLSREPEDEFENHSSSFTRILFGDLLFKKKSEQPEQKEASINTFTVKF